MKDERGKLWRYHGANLLGGFNRLSLVSKHICCFSSCYPDPNFDPDFDPDFDHHTYCTMVNDLYRKLIANTKGIVDRNGEVHIPCPDCGKESSPRDTHCSFNQNGFHCFVCGASYSLEALSKKLNLDEGKYNPPPRPERKAISAPIPSWKGAAWNLVRMFTESNEKYAWLNYKKISKASIDAYHLGYGVLPQSRCLHPRLIVPLICGDSIVGFRGREYNCECGKWLSSYGSKPVLYNGGQLVNNKELQEKIFLGKSPRSRAKNPVLFIVENPIDAILLEERMLSVGRENYRAVATQGVTIWFDDWTDAIRRAEPKLVVVVYDHDLAGNGGSSESDYNNMVEQWRLKNPKAKNPPVPNGIKLANRLLEAGITASVYRWSEGTPYKFDIGNLLMQTTSLPL